METLNKLFNTKIESLETLNSYSFSIPTYQRPYVWGDEQLKKLLDDFYKSFKYTPNSIYYVSTFLTKEEENKAELIDGQQRFTSLWLISFVLKNLAPASKISNFLKKGTNLRLGFDIRKEISAFLESLLEEGYSLQKIHDEEYINNHPYLRNIAKALVFINGYIKQLKIPQDELERFGNYIYQKVHLIKNTTPPNTDLNKLFSTINSAGVQLEQTDIVKANLLKLVDNKLMYAKIWESCENMHNFFERNVRNSFPETTWSNINFESLVSFDPLIFNYKNDSSNTDPSTEKFSIDALNIEEIEEYNLPERSFFNENTRNESKEIYCRSIISFPQLLLHTYRIHLHKEGLDDFEGTFHTSRLIEVFNQLENRNKAAEIKRFFLLLWDVRYLFDKYVIKWISDSETKTETLELVNINRNDKTYYGRAKYEKSKSMMLQSVLYFTGDYLRQYWLTTYLGYLLDGHKNLKAVDETTHLVFLEQIDNTFSLNNSLKDKDISWLLLKKNPDIQTDIDLNLYLNKPEGTSFKHYWFQKLEYILWKNGSFEKNDKFKNFRIISKNSIEHIYPQNPDRLQYAKMGDDFLHSFGNLVLLSVSQNSEYSNKPVSIKRSMFEAKGKTYDTLKSHFIFNSYNDWTEKTIAHHQKVMITFILDHYKIQTHDQ